MLGGGSTWRALHKQHAAWHVAKRRHWVRRRPRGRGRRRVRARAFCSLGPEKKFHDLAFSSDSIASTWATLSHAGGQSLNLIAQGLTESTRVGRRICVHNINIKGHLDMATATSAVGRNIVKLVLVQDRQANGADATEADVYETTSAGLHSYRNLANASRFKILATRHFTMNASISGNGTAIDTNAMIRYFSMSVKLEQPVEFDSTAGAITEVQSNNFFLMGVMQATTPAVVLSARCRLRFTD